MPLFPVGAIMYTAARCRGGANSLPPRGCCRWRRGGANSLPPRGCCRWRRGGGELASTAWLLPLAPSNAMSVSLKSPCSMLVSAVGTYSSAPPCGMLASTAGTYSSAQPRSTLALSSGVSSTPAPTTLKMFGQGPSGVRSRPCVIMVCGHRVGGRQPSAPWPQWPMPPWARTPPCRRAARWPQPSGTYSSVPWKSPCSMLASTAGT